MMWSLAAVYGDAPAPRWPGHGEPVIPVRPGVPSRSEAWGWQEAESLNPQSGEKTVWNVVTPTPTAYLPDRAKATATGTVVCLGGGFLFLSWDSEGAEVAQWLVPHGIAAFVLKYRLIPPPRPSSVSIRRWPHSSPESLLALLVWGAYNTIDKQLRRFKSDRRHRIDLLHQRRHR